MTWQRGSYNPDSAPTRTMSWWRNSYDVVKRLNDQKVDFSSINISNFNKANF